MDFEFSADEKKVSAEVANFIKSESTQALKDEIRELGHIYGGQRSRAFNTFFCYFPVALLVRPHYQAADRTLFWFGHGLVHCSAHRRICRSEISSVRPINPQLVVWQTQTHLSAR